MTPDDFIKVTQKIGPVEFDFNAFWRWLIRNDKDSQVTTVAKRFLSLFADHGVAATQIQHYLPQITLDKLDNVKALLPVLNNETLNQAAQLFKVRRQWLDGLDDQIYDWHHCYKVPARLFENLASIENKDGIYPVRALYAGKNLDGCDEREQPVILLLVEKIDELGDEEICRYTIFGDAWDWSHTVCRIQLKAMARLVDEVYQSPVPLYRVKLDVLEKIREGRRIPMGDMIGSQLTEPSLEDYALGEHESAQSKESEELPQVLAYIKKHDLENIARRS